MSLSNASEYTLFAEGDICWAYINNAFIIYIHHPDMQGKSLSNKKVSELLAKDELFTLEKLFAISNEVHFILELKTGNGNLDDFFVALQQLILKYDVKNLLVDAFSVNQLKSLKKIMPNIATSLHTKFVFGEYVLESTYEKPYIRIHNLNDLDFIDYVTLSYTTTHVNLLNLDIDNSYQAIYDAGKKLNLGSIKTLDAFNKAIASSAECIYLRSKEVLENYKDVLKGKRL